MFVKLVRLGRDAELRYAGEHAVINLACVYDIGYGDKKRGQWIEAALWGKQAEALAPYLLKGKQIVISADDLELDTFTKNDGTVSSKLKCRVVNVDLTSGGQQAAPQQAPVQQQRQQTPQQQQAPQRAPAPDFDDSIPF